MRALQFSRDTCLTNLSFIFPLDRRCSSGFRWKLSLFRICQIGVAHIIYAYSKAAASSVTHFIFFSSHSTTVISYKLYIRRNTMHAYLQVFVCKDDRMRNNNLNIPCTYTFLLPRSLQTEAIIQKLHFYRVKFEALSSRIFL